MKQKGQFPFRFATILYIYNYYDVTLTSLFAAKLAQVQDPPTSAILLQCLVSVVIRLSRWKRWSNFSGLSFGISSSFTPILRKICDFIVDIKELENVPRYTQLVQTDHNET